MTKEVLGQKQSAKSTDAKTKEAIEATEYRDAYSIQEFCRRHNISNSTYYNLRNSGKGPREARVMTRVLITREAAADWRRQIEIPVTR